MVNNAHPELSYHAWMKNRVPKRFNFFLNEQRRHVALPSILPTSMNGNPGISAWVWQRLHFSHTYRAKICQNLLSSQLTRKSGGGKGGQAVLPPYPPHLLRTVHTQLKKKTAHVETQAVELSRGLSDSFKAAILLLLWLWYCYYGCCMAALQLDGYHTATTAVQASWLLCTAAAMSSVAARQLIRKSYKQLSWHAK